MLFSLTNVPPERQKIVGLSKGKLPAEHEEVVKLGLGPSAPGKCKEFMMMYARFYAPFTPATAATDVRSVISGTPEGEEARGSLPSEKEDGDMDYAADESKMKAFMAVQSVRNRRKLKEHAEKLDMSIIVRSVPASLALPVAPA